MALDLTDKTANANDLTNVNGVTDVTTSLASITGTTDAAGFASASSQTLTANDAASLKQTGNLTWEGWVKTSTTGATQTLFQSYSQNTAVAGIFIYINTSNHITFRSGKNTGTTGADFAEASGTTNVCDGSWHHVACTWDGSTLTVYVDGNSDGTAAWANAPAYAATNYVRLGSNNNTGSNTNFLNGNLDDVRLWSTNRSQAQIQNNKGIRLTGSEANLVAYWPFETLVVAGSSVVIVI